MRSMSSHAIAIAVAALVLAGCERQAPAPAPDPAASPAPAAAPAPEPAVVATETAMAQPGVQPGADPRPLAGTYAGTLRCADCPGIDETLVLDARGGFVLTDSYRERPGAGFEVRGSWSLEDGGRLLLDPDSKGERDRFYAIDGDDALVPLDTEGKRIEGGPVQRLVRR